MLGSFINSDEFLSSIYLEFSICHFFINSLENDVFSILKNSHPHISDRLATVVFRTARGCPAFMRGVHRVVECTCLIPNIGIGTVITVAMYLRDTILYNHSS